MFRLTTLMVFVIFPSLCKDFIYHSIFKPSLSRSRFLSPRRNTLNFDPHPDHYYLRSPSDQADPPPDVIWTDIDSHCFGARPSVWGSHFTKTVDNYRKSIVGDSHKSTHFRTIGDWLARNGLFNTLSFVMMLENLNNYSQFMVTRPKLTLSSLSFSRRRQNICNQSISLFMFPKWSILQICFFVSFIRVLKCVILKHTHTRKEF